MANPVSKGGLVNNEFHPLIFVVGATGRGKSTGIRNMNPDTTVIINTENKPLPFPGATKFTRHLKTQEPYKAIEYIDQLAKREDIESIVLDSFSAWGDSMYKLARSTEKGWDVQNLYNARMQDLFDAAKSSNKYVFFIGHPEIVETSDGATVKSVKVKGNEWKGVTEKEATIVLYAEMEADGLGNNRYFLRTQSDGINNAKSPMGMFDTYEIENDYAKVVEAVKKYYK